MGINWRKDWPWVLFALLVVALVQIVQHSTGLADEPWQNFVGKLVAIAIVVGTFVASFRRLVDTSGPAEGSARGAPGLTRQDSGPLHRVPPSTSV